MNGAGAELLRQFFALARVERRLQDPSVHRLSMLLREARIRRRLASIIESWTVASLSRQ